MSIIGEFLGIFRKKELTNAEHLNKIARAAMSINPFPAILLDGKVIYAPEYLAYRIGNNIWLSYKLDGRIINKFYDTESQIVHGVIKTSYELGIEAVKGLLRLDGRLPSSYMPVERIYFEN